MDDKEKHHVLFTQLVIMFHTATMQHLGKIKNPMTDTVERDLHAAQSTIDLLDMLKSKTQGNLLDDEERLLTQVLQEVKLNYVDERGKEQPAAQEGEGKP